jgi:16S rRNA (uracil1498-N3)-methyltransferase
MEQHSLERFYLKGPLAKGLGATLKDTEHHHLTKVLRARVGDQIELVNGEGFLASAKVVNITKEQTLLEISDVDFLPAPSSQIILGLPFMRPSKLEWVIEKGTEIGADSFFLYPADYSTQESFSTHQIERFRTITISALKQSKRLYLPHLEILPHLKSLLAKDAVIFFGDTQKNAPMLEEGVHKTTLFVTGPESGFSKQEVDQLKAKATGCRINQNILRAETAPIVALSLLNFNKDKFLF